MVGTASPTTIAGASVLQIGSDKLTEANSNGQLVIGKNNGSSTRKFRLGLDDNYHLSMGDFGHSNDNTYAPQVTIRWDNGNVGIGVPVPTEKLEVQGMVKATALKADSLTIGQYTFDENAMQLLSFLVKGELDVELYNLEQKEYMYAADYAPFDDDRRRIFTWRRKEANGEGVRVSQGTWRLQII